MENFYMVISSTLGSAIQLFSLPVPGFEEIHLSFASLFIGFSAVIVIVRFVLNILGLGSVAGSLPVNVSIRQARGSKHE